MMSSAPGRSNIQNTSNKKASDALISHWQNGTTLPILPESMRPKTVGEGYDIQSHIERLSASKPIWGWKIAATSVHGQQHINVDRPLAGRILAERVTTYGEPVPLGSNRMRVAELEFAFRIGEDIEPRPQRVWEVKEVMKLIDGLFLGSEIPDSRYDDFVSVGAAQLVADNACADRYVLGPEVKDWRGRDLVEHVVKGWIEGSDVITEGTGGNVLGDPRVAMTWMVNELSMHGVKLYKGQYVTTGTCAVPLAIKPGDRLIGDYGDMGKIEIDFAT
jgi:2-keto-4-pentenoate hydratase